MDKNKMFITYRGELDDRLDVKFYLPIFKENLLKLKSKKFERLGNLISFSNETWNQTDFFKDEFPYIEIGEIDLKFGQIKKVRYMPIEQAPSRAKMIVRKGDIIVSMTRPHRGAIVGIGEKYDKFICSTGFAVLRTLLNEDVTKDYLRVILRENFILTQMKQRSSGGNYPAIIQDELKKIVIPIHHNKNAIFLSLNKAHEKYKKSLSIYKNLLNNFNQLLSEKSISTATYNIVSPKIIHLLNLENALNVERYAFTYELDTPSKWHTIKDVGSVKLQTLTPSDDLNKEKAFTLLRIDDLPNKPFKPVSRSVHGSDIDGNVQHINTNDVLVARLAPTVRNKKIIIAPESDLPIIGSNEFIRLTCNEENNPIFVCYLLRTEFYTELMLSKSRGSTPSRYRLSRADFEKLPFPKVPKAVQDEIAAEYLKNISEAQRLIKEGKEAVKKAKKEVEAMILGE